MIGPDVMVTGIGPICCVGKTKDEMWKNIMDGVSGVEYFNKPWIFPEITCRVAAVVKDFDFRNYTDNDSILSLLKDESTRTIQLGIAAALQAIKDSKLDLNKIDRERVGIFVATFGNLDYVYARTVEFMQGKLPPPQSGFLAFPGTIASLLSGMLDVKGPADTISGGCPSGMDALGYAARCISAGIIDVAIVVGSDNEASETTFNGIAAANGVATSYNDQPKRSSRPFDKNREGNVIGENACALIVESKSHAEARQVQMYARVAGYAKRSVGTRVYSHNKPTLSTDASVRTIKAVLQDAKWKTTDVDVFSANGSASVSYDRLEANSIVAVFDAHAKKLLVQSIKGMIGQSGAGCTIVHIAATCLCLYYKKLYKTVNFEEQDPNLPVLNIVKKAQDAPFLKRIICQAIGFGGFHYSCLALEAISTPSSKL